MVCGGVAIMLASYQASELPMKLAFVGPFLAGVGLIWIASDLFDF